MREAAVLLEKARGSYQPGTLENAEKQFIEMKDTWVSPTSRLTTSGGWGNWRWMLI